MTQHLDQGRVEWGIAASLHPRFYFRRLRPGIVVHLWRFWFAWDRRWNAPFDEKEGRG